MYRITDLESTDRPRDRLQELGVGALSTAELIAILIRTGIQGRNALQLAQDLLKAVGGLAGLHQAPFEVFRAVPGIGAAKSAQLKAAIELGRRIAVASPESRPRIQSPDDAAALVLFEMSALIQEHMRVIMLNTRNDVLKITELYRGSLNTSVIRVGEIFREAIQANAASIILVHNHPSGDPSPSPEDIAVTKALVEAGKMLDIEVVDHIVIGQNCYVSMKRRGLGFRKGDLRS
ncbi:MAG: DNA repair protein RadC [Anaerolineales bacterium]|nr:DNA repair protein RadC [Anaerolineales bacterium]